MPKFCVLVATHVEAPDVERAQDHVMTRSPAGSVLVEVQEIGEEAAHG